MGIAAREVSGTGSQVHARHHGFDAQAGAIGEDIRRRRAKLVGKCCTMRMDAGTSRDSALTKSQEPKDRGLKGDADHRGEAAASAMCRPQGRRWSPGRVGTRRWRRARRLQRDGRPGRAPGGEPSDGVVLER